MSKTITIRLDDQTYDLIRKAAAGDRRSISNYIEYATMAHLSDEMFASDQEMEEIMADQQLTAELKKAKADTEAGRYTIVD